jgi:hypothetical protein
MGLTRHQLAAINREITKKLRKNRDALHSYLGFLPEAEKNCQFSWTTRQNQRTLGLLSERLRMTIAELTEKKVAESAKLARIQERVHTSRIALEDAEGAVSKIERVLRTEQEAAILDERDWPDPAAGKQLAAARAKVVSAESVLSATMGALAKQAAAVEAVEGKLFERKMEIFEAELEPAKERAFRLMAEFCQAATELNMIANKHGIGPHGLGQALYPRGVDPLDGRSERMGRCELLTHAIRFQSELWYRFRKAV